MGAGTAVRGEQCFLQPGEVIEASIEGIGNLRIPVKGEDAPIGLTGAQLPPGRQLQVVFRTYLGNKLNKNPQSIGEHDHANAWAG